MPSSENSALNGVEHSRKPCIERSASTKTGAIPLANLRSTPVFERVSYGLIQEEPTTSLVEDLMSRHAQHWHLGNESVASS